MNGLNTEYKMSLQEIPNPRPESLALCVMTIGFTYLSHITHADVNLWLATVAGCLSIAHYSITFYKIYHKRKNK